MSQLDIKEEGCLCTLTYRSMPEGTFAKFKAMTPEFHDLSDQRAVFVLRHCYFIGLGIFTIIIFSLEVKLGPFSCLTVGDIIPIEHAERVYELLVTEVPRYSIYLKNILPIFAVETREPRAHR